MLAPEGTLLEELELGVRLTLGGRGKCRSLRPGNGSSNVATDGPVPDLAAGRGKGTERCEVLEAAEFGCDIPNRAEGMRCL